MFDSRIFIHVLTTCHIIVQYSTDQLIKEVENSIEEFKRYNQDYDEGNIKQQVSRQFFLVFFSAEFLQSAAVWQHTFDLLGIK
jgi:hypothetical protein